MAKVGITSFSIFWGYGTEVHEHRIMASGFQDIERREPACQVYPHKGVGTQNAKHLNEDAVCYIMTRRPSCVTAYLRSSTNFHEHPRVRSGTPSDLTRLVPIPSSLSKQVSTSVYASIAVGILLCQVKQLDFGLTYRTSKYSTSSQ